MFSHLLYLLHADLKKLCSSFKGFSPQFGSLTYHAWDQSKFLFLSSCVYVVFYSMTYSMPNLNKKQSMVHALNMIHLHAIYETSSKWYSRDTMFTRYSKFDLWWPYTFTKVDRILVRYQTCIAGYSYSTIFTFWCPQTVDLTFDLSPELNGALAYKPVPAVQFPHNKTFPNLGVLDRVHKGGITNPNIHMHSTCHHDTKVRVIINLKPLLIRSCRYSLFSPLRSTLLLK